MRPRLLLLLAGTANHVEADSAANIVEADFAVFNLYFLTGFRSQALLTARSHNQIIVMALRIRR